MLLMDYDKGGEKDFNKFTGNVLVLPVVVLKLACW
jgi:hypothetical protein